MTGTPFRRLGLRLAATAALAFGLAGDASAQGGDDPPPPRFVKVSFGGPLDSIYHAEYQRLSSECSGLGDACWVERLDTTAVSFVPVWAEPGVDEPVGRLVARLRIEGRWPRAALLFQRRDGREVTLRDDMGDWGYGAALAIRGWRDGFVQPWMFEPVGEYWIGESEVGYALLIADRPFGLEGILWRFRPGRAVPVRGEAAPSPSTAEPVELPLAVYKILGVRDGLVRLRPEIPQDMDCEPMESASPSGPMPVYEIPLARLFAPSGRPEVELAYPKGC